MDAERLNVVQEQFNKDLAEHRERMAKHLQEFDRAIGLARSESSSCDIQQTRQLPAV